MGLSSRRTASLGDRAARRPRSPAAPRARRTAGATGRCGRRGARPAPATAGARPPGRDCRGIPADRRERARQRPGQPCLRARPAEGDRADPGGQRIQRDGSEGAVEIGHHEKWRGLVEERDHSPPHVAPRVECGRMRTAGDWRTGPPVGHGLTVTPGRIDWNRALITSGPSWPRVPRGCPRGRSRSGSAWRRRPSAPPRTP